MRDLAIHQYGCIDFISVTENDQKISVSYWENEQQIKIWKQDAQYLEVQRLCKAKWYESYQVEIVKITRQYSQDE